MTPEPLAARGLTQTDVFALTLHHEAAGEGRRGMVAVGKVILRRAALKFTGRTVREVCLARGQYSCWAPTQGKENHHKLVEHANRIRLGTPPAEIDLAYEVARSLLEGGEVDETGRADHYYAPGAMVPRGSVPYWAEGQTPTAEIGGHIFLKLRPESRA